MPRGTCLPIISSVVQVGTGRSSRAVALAGVAAPVTRAAPVAPAKPARPAESAEAAPPVASAAAGLAPVAVSEEARICRFKAVGDATPAKQGRGTSPRNEVMQLPFVLHRIPLDWSNGLTAMHVHPKRCQVVSDDPEAACWLTCDNSTACFQRHISGAERSCL